VEEIPQGYLLHRGTCGTTIAVPQAIGIRLKTYPKGEREK
jgi:hypothetical protein